MVLSGNGIAVYDIKGSDLKEVYASLEQDIPYFHQNMRQLRGGEIGSRRKYDRMRQRRKTLPQFLGLPIVFRSLYNAFYGNHVTAKGIGRERIRKYGFVFRGKQVLIGGGSGRR